MNSQNFVLVVQTPDRKGEGYEFLVVNMKTSEFDQRLWKGGKCDQLILTIAEMSHSTNGHCIGQYRAKIGYRAFVRAIREDLDITSAIKKVRLDFTLSSQTEVVDALIRWNRADFAKYITKLEQDIERSERHIGLIQNTLTNYRTYVKSDVLSGVRAHYERVLMVDSKRDLRDVRAKLKSLRKLLHDAHKAHPMLEKAEIAIPS